MRRRPSGSGEDEDPSKPTTSPDSSEWVEKSRGMAVTKDNARSARESPKSPERRISKDSRASSPPKSRPAAFSQPGIAESPLEKCPLSPSTRGEKQQVHATSGARQHTCAPMRSPWRCSSLTVVISVCSMLLLLLIGRSFFTRQIDPKGCAMSYMRPAFTRFADFDTEHTRFATKYSLYLYREGGIDTDDRVKGIPVLFIPGNAGSYKQMRPIAAEAAQYFHDVLRTGNAAISDGKRPLDVFTVDFNEELTAFHGQTLLDQAEYLNEAIAYILALYHNPQRASRGSGLPEPKSVIIIGHSMGGVVARTMLRMSNYQESSINTIFTLSAPHARAPVSFDAEMVATYEDVNSFWRRSFSARTPAENPLADITLVSVAGGSLDTMIASEYSSLTSLVPDSHGFTVFTSSIPNVWTGMDHLAIMWCDQFRKALVRAIFDVVDARRASQTRRQPERVAALRKRLLTGMESVVQKSTIGQESTTILSLDRSFATIMTMGERLDLRGVGATDETKAYVMPVPEQVSSEGIRLTVLTDQPLNIGDDNATVAVFLCSISQPPFGASVLSFALSLDTIRGFGGTDRLICKNAAADVSLLPASTNQSVNAFDNTVPFSYLQYDLDELSDSQFVAIIENPSAVAPGWLIAEFSDAAQSTRVVSKGHHQLLMNGLQLDLPASRAVMAELKIPEVHSTLFAYKLTLDREPCGQPDERFAPLLRQSIQEPYESKYFVNVRDANINVHGISPYMPPPLGGGGASDGLSLQLWTDPTCNSTVRVSLRVDVLGSTGKLVMRYRSVFAAFPVLVVATILRKQFKVYDTTGSFMSFSQSMDQCLRTSLPTVFTALTFLSVALSKANKGPLTRSWFGTSAGFADNVVDYTINDLILGTSDPFFWFLVPLFGVISVGICVAFNYLVLAVTHAGALVYSRRGLSNQCSNVAARTNPGGIPPQRRLITTALLLLLVVTVAPYQFAYLALSIVQLLTAVRALHAARHCTTGTSLNFYNYVHSMLILMLWLLPMNLLVLTVWVRNLAVRWLTPFSTERNLLCILPFMLFVETVNMGYMVPRLLNRTRYLTNTLTFALALYAAIFGVTYAYRLHYLVDALAAWLTLIHVAAGAGPFSLARLPRFPAFSSATPLSTAASSTSAAASSPSTSNRSARRTKKRP